MASKFIPSVRQKIRWKKKHKMTNEKLPINGATHPAQKTALTSEQVMGLVPSAMKVVTQAIKIDPGYRTTWVANIAMAFKDAFRSDAEVSGIEMSEEKRLHVHRIANEAAENFMNILTSDGGQEKESSVSI